MRLAIRVYPWPMEWVSKTSSEGDGDGFEGRGREHEKRRVGGQAGGSRNRRVTLAQETQRVDRVEGKGHARPGKE